ncbi:MAG: DNA-binding protein [Actinomycetia bacterium]|nr:DNA-binding protein [Actinomycetes bacterium]
MPMYQCFAVEGTFDDEQRQRLAGALTEIHCSETTAPPTFVHVLFHDRDPEPGGAAVRLHGGIRYGRPQSTTDSLVRRMTEAVAAETGLSLDQITMGTSETPASWIMEGGRVMPEPGEEDAWLANSI